MPASLPVQQLAMLSPSDIFSSKHLVKRHNTFT